MKILIVEDEKEIAWIWKEELKGNAHKIKIAEDGEQAILFAKSFLPEIILLDLILPKKGGLDVLAELKADENLKKIPVIVLSNLAEDETIKKGFCFGRNRLFCKNTAFNLRSYRKSPETNIKLIMQKLLVLKKSDSGGFGLIDFIIIGSVICILAFIVITNIIAHAY